jgi:ribosome maturation factor RimP
MMLEEKIEKLIKKEIESLGCELKKVEIKQKRASKELIITIDKEGGVSVEDCARVSKRIDPILEKANLFESRWYLIVSSPGIEISKEDLEKLK